MQMWEVLLDNSMAWCSDIFVKMGLDFIIVERFNYGFCWLQLKAVWLSELLPQGKASKLQRLMLTGFLKNVLWILSHCWTSVFIACVYCLCLQVVSLTGSLLNMAWQSDDAPANVTPCTVLIGRPIADLVNSELALDERTFVSRLSMDLHFSYCDDV